MWYYDCKLLNKILQFSFLTYIQPHVFHQCIKQQTAKSLRFKDHWNQKILETRFEAEWCKALCSTDLDFQTHAFLEHFSARHPFWRLQNKHISNVLPCLVGMVTLHRVCTCSLLFPLRAHTDTLISFELPLRAWPLSTFLCFSTDSKHADMFPAD